MAQFTHDFYQALVSPLTLRICVAAIASAAVALSFWIAYTRRAAVIELRPFRGPPIKREATIRARIQRLEYLRKHAVSTTILNLLAVLVFGFVVPAAALVLGLHYYAWFFPQSRALVSPGAMAAPTLAATGWFVLSQFAMGISGAASDVVSHASAFSAPYVPGDTLVVLAIGAYRYFVAIFVGVFGQLLIAAVRMTRPTAIEAAIAELKDQLIHGARIATNP
jgi:hypothetical protein